ncbi:MAG: hypothetical protein V4714_20460 [Bacteroidota bacterium]
MNKTKGEVMNHVLTKLQDVQNSQRALIEKMASIQIELFDQPDAALEKAVESALGSISLAADELNPAVETYEKKVNAENPSLGMA